MTQYVDIQYIRNALGITGTKESCKGCKYNDRIGFACNTYEAPSFAYVCEVLDDAPTVDAVPVVRCKDCKWYNSEKFLCNNNESFSWKKDDFCSFAERKEE